MSTIGRVIRGAGWLYGAQILTVACQFGYAAVSSRLLGPQEFAAYAVALALYGLVSLLATAGLGQAVSRAMELDQVVVSRLVSAGVVLGVLGALTVWASASVWAHLWANGNATTACQVAALGAFCGPLSGLLNGLARRLGKYRALAIWSFIASVIGFAVGVVFIIEWRSAAALMVSSATTSLATVASLSMFVCRRYVRLGNPFLAREELSFSAKFLVAALLGFLSGNVLKLALSRSGAIEGLGYWNRAEMLTTLPLQQAQTAILQAVYPEFRRDRADPLGIRARWTDIVVFLAWTMLPLAGIGYSFAPYLIHFVFGPRWIQAGALAGILFIVGCVQVISVIFAAAIESFGAFRIIWVAEGVTLAILVAGAVFVYLYQSVLMATLMVLLAVVARHVVHLIGAVRRGHLDRGRIVGAYLSSGLCACVLGVAFLVIGRPYLDPLDGGRFVLMICVLALVFAGCWLWRGRWPAWQVFSRYRRVG